MKLKYGVFGAFAFGFGLGATAHKWWPPVKETLTPLGKSLLKAGMDAAEKAKESFWDKSEKFADVIAEIKEDQETQTKASAKAPTPVSAQPKYDA